MTGQPQRTSAEEMKTVLATLRLANSLLAQEKITWEQRVRVHNTFVDGIGSLDNSAENYDDNGDPLDLPVVFTNGKAPKVRDSVWDLFSDSA